jgi:hypothetical protein
VEKHERARDVRTIDIPVSETAMAATTWGTGELFDIRRAFLASNDDAYLIRFACSQGEALRSAGRRLERERSVEARLALRYLILGAYCLYPSLQRSQLDHNTAAGLRTLWTRSTVSVLIPTVDTTCTRGVDGRAEAGIPGQFESSRRARTLQSAVHVVSHATAMLATDATPFDVRLSFGPLDCDARAGGVLF